MKDHPPLRLGDVDVRHATGALLAACGAVFAVLLAAMRDFDFFYDEWHFVLGAPQRSVTDLFHSYEGHCFALPLLLYTVLLRWLGAGSHLPFSMIQLLLHVSVVLQLFRLIRDRAGALPALLAAALLLVPSRGFENLINAFQMNWLGSMVAGLLAWRCLDRAGASRARVASASAALLAGLFCSGAGVVFLAAVAVDVLSDRQRRDYAAALVVPAVSWTCWFLALGPTGRPEPLLSAEGLIALWTYVPSGVAAAAAGLFGLPPRFGPAALAGLFLLLAAGVRLGARLDSHARGALAGLGLLYALAGLSRWRLGDAQAASPRYVYVGAVFLLLVVAPVLRELPWRGAWKGLPLLLVPVLAINALQLRRIIATRSAEFATQAATLRTVWFFRQSPGLDRDAVMDAGLMPGVRAGSYVAARADLGSPLAPASFAELGRLPAAAVNAAATAVLPLRIVDATAQPCTPVAQAPTPLDTSAPSGTTFVIHATDADHLLIELGLFGPGPGQPVLARALPRGSTIAVTLPVTEPVVPWRLRLHLPVGWRVCRRREGESAPAVHSGET